MTNNSIYNPSLSNAGLLGGAGTMGAWIKFTQVNGEAHGTWAVTAP